jgi:hypothetical protein
LREGKLKTISVATFAALVAFSIATPVLNASAQPNPNWVNGAVRTGAPPSGQFPTDIVDLKRQDRELLQRAEENVQNEEKAGERWKRVGGALPVAGAPEGADMLLKGMQYLAGDGLARTLGGPSVEEQEAQAHAAFVNNEVIKLQRQRDKQRTQQLLRQSEAEAVARDRQRAMTDQRAANGSMPRIYPAPPPLTVYRTPPALRQVPVTVASPIDDHCHVAHIGGGGQLASC